MSFPICELAAGEFPSLLREIPQPPESLYFRGQLPTADLKLISVVGSRKYSSYGQQVVDHLITGLKNYPIGIVSGLALGIDALAHKAALQNGIYTLAVPGSGIDDSVIYPASHRHLAKQILEAGGGLLSEFKPTMRAAKWTFPARNRIMAGLTHATLLIEAAEKSGTLITARLTADYNRELLVVPGNIFSTNSKGVHQFLKLGATPVTNATDILLALGFDLDEAPTLTGPTMALSTKEKLVIETLLEPRDTDTLVRLLGLPTSEINVLLIQMEIKGLVASQGGKYISLL